MDILYIIGAKYLFILPILLGLWLFINASKLLKKELLIFSIPALGISLLLGKILNRYIYNSRPFVEEGFSPLIKHAPDNGFPSDHMLLVASIAMIITFYNKKIGALLWFLAILVGASRVMVGVHHWADILGSTLIAITSSTAIYWLLKKRRVL
jgi:undecaprenyl-diphosphatase